MHADSKRPACGNTRDRKTTMGGRGDYTTSTGQKPDWGEGACCFALFSLPLLLGMLGGLI